MKHLIRNRFRRGGAVCRLLAVALVCACAAGCSGEVYDPNGTGGVGTAEITGAVNADAPSVSDASDGVGTDTGSRFEPTEQDLRVDFLDTGKSDAILLRAGGTVVLVDTGESDDYGRISGRLDAYGITTIDHLILTHFDKDHIGSAAQILENYAVGRVYLPDYARDSELYRRTMEALEAHPAIEVLRVVESVAAEFSGGRLVIHPTALYESGLVLGADEDHDLEENNFSLMTEVFFGDAALLLAGDAEEDRLEEFLTCGGASATYDLIKIPHHGGYDKAVRDLLQQSSGRLRYCVVHAGEASDVEALLVKAMRSTAAAVYYTYHGTVCFATNGADMFIEQE